MFWLRIPSCYQALYPVFYTSKLAQCYETTSRKETIFCVFLNLVDNIQEYNTKRI